MDPMPSPRVNGPQPPSMAASGRASAAPLPPMGGPSDKPVDAPSPAQDLAARIEAELPEPKNDGYDPKLLLEVEGALREAWAFVREVAADLPEIPAELLAKDIDGAGKLPMALMVPVLLLSDLAVSLGGPAGKRYGIDPETLVDDKALRRVLAQLRVMAEDKALAKALMGAMGAMGEPETDEAPKPVGKAMAEPPPIPKGISAGL